LSFGRWRWKNSAR